MSRFRLVRVRGQQRQQQESWPLLQDHPISIGRNDSEQSTPDIDLWPDPKVSRRHASIWYDKGVWWIKDESKNGTRVGRQKLQGGETIRLEPGVEIQMGNTVLMYVSPYWHRLTGRNGNLVVELEVSPAINYALVHCGVPAVSRLVVRNWGAQQSTPGTLEMAVEGYGRTEKFAIPALQPGQSVDLPQPQFRWNIQMLEARIERVKSAV